MLKIHFFPLSASCIHGLPLFFFWVSFLAVKKKKEKYPPSKKITCSDDVLMKTMATIHLSFYLSKRGDEGIMEGLSKRMYGRGNRLRIIFEEDAKEWKKKRFDGGSCLEPNPVVSALNKSRRRSGGKDDTA